MKTLIGVVLLFSAVSSTRANVLELSFSGVADAQINYCILQPSCTTPSQTLSQQPFTLSFFGDTTVLGSPPLPGGYVPLSFDDPILGGSLTIGTFFGTLPTLQEAPAVTSGASLLGLDAGQLYWYEGQPLYTNAGFLAPELTAYNFDSNLMITDVTMTPEGTVRGPGGFLFNGNQVLLSNWSTLTLTATLLTPEPSSAFISFLGITCMVGVVTFDRLRRKPAWQEMRGRQQAPKMKKPTP